MKPVIINISTGQYIKGQKRLEQTIKTYSQNIPFLSWTNETQIQAPPHKVNPYAFKVYAFYRAIQQGYDTIFWMDASCYLIKDVTPLFEMIDKDGYFMHEAGHYAGSWINDHAKAYFGIEQSILDTLPMFTAGCFGLSAYSQTAMTFLDDWRKSMEAGCFKGDWSNHRHDMVCGSIVAKSLAMDFQFGENYLEYAAPETTPKNETIIIKLQGVC